MVSSYRILYPLCSWHVSIFRQKRKKMAWDRCLTPFYSIEISVLFITHFRQFGCLVCRDAGIDDFLDVSIHDLIQFI